MLLLFVSRLRRCPGGFTELTILHRSAKCLFACVERHPARSDGYRPSSPRNFRAQNPVKLKKNRCFT